jgi:hypothetical protein
VAFTIDTSGTLYKGSTIDELSVSIGYVTSAEASRKNGLGGTESPPTKLKHPAHQRGHFTCFVLVQMPMRFWRTTGCRIQRTGTHKHRFIRLAEHLLWVVQNADRRMTLQIRHPHAESPTAAR